MRVDFLSDIDEEEHIKTDKVIWIVALNGGVLVSSRIIREFLNSPRYNGDLNKLIRDVTKYQRVMEVEPNYEIEDYDSEDKEQEYQVI